MFTELLSYDPITGLCTWLVAESPRIKIGDVAGSFNKDSGYHQIKIRGKTYRMHRLAWYLTYGAWPQGQIDHINGDRADNRISNLRDVTHSVNAQNLHRARKDNKTTKLLGAYPKGNKFQSQIMVGGSGKYLGLFDTPELAHEAYLNAKRSFHEGCTI